MKYTMKHKVATVTITAALLFGSAAVMPAPAAYAAQTAEVTWGVNMRTAPTSSSSIIRMLRKGEHISIIAEVNSDWYKISDDKGKIGYISSSSRYTNASAQAGIGSPSSDAGPTAVPAITAIVKRSVSFRSKPSASADRIRYLKTNEQVRVTGQPSSYWYEVIDSKGVKGYVSTQSQYLSISGGTSSSSSTRSELAVSAAGEAAASDSHAAASSNASIEKVISAGMKYLGTPYEFGSNRNTTATFDCSDFTRQAFKDALGITLPADSRQQGDYVKKKGNMKTSISQLKRGDLLFFMSYRGSSASAYSGVNKSTQRITHVGIYLGDGKILHTYSKESGGVRINTIVGTHWEKRFLFGGSAL